MALAELATPTTRIIDQDHERVGKWLASLCGGTYREGATCIGLARHGELVAGTMYDSYNGASIVATIAIQGPITRKWLHWIFAYPFLQLNAKVILGPIASDNHKSIALVENMGFKLVATIPDADPSGALCLYALHRNDCRFLKGRHD